MADIATKLGAPSIEGLTVAAVGLVGDALRLCCTVPRPYTRGERGQVVVGSVLWGRGVLHRVCA